MAVHTVRAMRRLLLAGLGVMGAVALAAAIWPAVAGLVTGLLVTVLGAAAGVLAGLGGRRVRMELAWRRELRTMPPPAAAAYGDTAGPTLAQLRESA
ncbi:MAG: hypothetical protein AB7V42_16710 [Thermoleophilia bacterium]